MCQIFLTVTWYVVKKKIMLVIMGCDWRREKCAAIWNISISTWNMTEGYKAMMKDVTDGIKCDRLETWLVSGGVSGDLKRDREDTWSLGWRRVSWYKIWSRGKVLVSGIADMKCDRRENVTIEWRCDYDLEWDWNKMWLVIGDGKCRPELWPRETWILIGDVTDDTTLL